MPQDGSAKQVECFLLVSASFFELLLFTATFPGRVDCFLNTYLDNAAPAFFLLIHLYFSIFVAPRSHKSW